MIWVIRPAANARLLILSALLVSGCSSSDFQIVPVSGTVTLDGEPLASAMVVFNPRATGEDIRSGPDSFARTDDQGHYELETIDGFRGAVVAPHRVRIRTRREEEGPAGEVKVISQEVLPAKYHDETELTFQVPRNGTTSADFELTSN